MSRPEQDRLITAYLEDEIGRAPITDHVDQEKIMLRVQAKHRNRTIAAGLGSLALVLGVGGALSAVAGGDDGARPARPVRPAVSTAAPSSFIAPKALTRCGARLAGDLRPSTGPLTLEITPASSVGAGEDFRVTAVVTNISDEAVSAVSSTAPTVSMVAAGTVVMTQGPGRLAGTLLQLQPGQSRSFDLTLVAGRCPRKATRISAQDFARQHPLPGRDYRVHGVYSFQIGDQPLQAIASTGHDMSVAPHR